ncbi:tripartite tricarboxylate transporter substrate binding protein [Oceanicola sp. 22II-s10i]|uniref:Bug family tripartite tricarboxylate transporter substrate binding protein n=1 Tax=Oceanicola sp. 22II-s10i TaxID=1317116 RepID=UPI00159548CC|nr:tripartite tricarboxylate transporter substrate binding protein [Oceanicola sp. 22II-s10i]
MFRKLFAAAATAAVLATGVTTAQAQDYPSDTVRIIVPYSAGGVTDFYARLIAPELQEAWGQTVIVENKPGSGSLLGAMEVGTSEPDGLTLLLGSYGLLSNQILLPDSPYDPASIEPVYLLGRGSNMLIIGSEFEHDTLDSLTQYAKDNPGKLKVASSGIGASPHIAALLWADKVGVNFLHIPYQGTAPAMTDVLAGRVDVIFDGISSMANVRAGKTKALAIAAAKRSPEAPDVPTFNELGIPFEFGSFFGFFVPTGTPQDIQDTIFEAVAKIARREDIDAQLQKRGLDTTPKTQADFKDFMTSELAALKKLEEQGLLAK